MGQRKSTVRSVRGRPFIFRLAHLQRIQAAKRCLATIVLAPGNPQHAVANSRKCYLPRPSHKSKANTARLTTLQESLRRTTPQVNHLISSSPSAAMLSTPSPTSASQNRYTRSMPQTSPLQSSKQWTIRFPHSTSSNTFRCFARLSYLFLPG
jgi:hypothetical protein